jgi:4-amino-4-deoxy-L-arabinose transferase-like glycosyltransferase
MNLFFLFVNIILVLFGAIFLLSQLDLRDRAGYLIAIFIFAYANIVLVLQLAGLFSLIDKVPVLFLQFLITAILVVIWFRNDRPNLLGPFWGINWREYLSRETLLQSLKFPWVHALALGVGFVYIKHVQTILSIHPSTADSLTYHLSKVGYWLQYQSFYPWTTANLRQTIFPMNAELGLLWSTLWWGNDQLTGFVQWLTVPAIMLSLYGLVRLMGYSRLQGGLVALLWATLPQVMYQSISTQNDLVVASFWAGAVYFLFAGLHKKSEVYVSISGVGLGLAIGAKSTSLMMLPTLVVIIMLVVWLHRKSPNIFQFVFRWGIATLLSVMAFGSYIYIQNMVAFGHPLGPKDYTSSLIGTKEDDTVILHLNLLRDNTARYLYQLVDFSPLPEPLPEALNPVRKAVFSSLYDQIGINVTNPTTIYREDFDLDYVNPMGENASWFGPLMVILIPSIIFQLFQGVQKKDALRIALALFAIGFLATNSAAQAWTPAKGRYYMIAVTLAFPLLAGVLDTSQSWRRWLSALPVILGLAVLMTVSGKTTSRALDWTRIVEGERIPAPIQNELLYRFVLESVPDSTSIGVVGYADLRDYPLFGEHFTRQVTWALPDNLALSPRTNIDRFVSDFESSEYLFISTARDYRAEPRLAIEFAPQYFDLLIRGGKDSVWVRKELRNVNDCEQDTWPFNKLFMLDADKICPQFPIIAGIPTRAPNGIWRPEVGNGEDEGLLFGIFIKEPALLEIRVRINEELSDLETFQMQIIEDGEIAVLAADALKKNEVIFAQQFDAGKYMIRFVKQGGQDSIFIQKIVVNTR